MSGLKVSMQFASLPILLTTLLALSMVRDLRTPWRQIWELAWPLSPCADAALALAANLSLSISRCSGVLSGIIRALSPVRVLLLAAIQTRSACTASERIYSSLFHLSKSKQCALCDYL